jgi:hypothetical protein
MSHSRPPAEAKLTRANLLTIDPGFRYFAYAVFSDQVLQHADLVRAHKVDEWEVWTRQPPDFSEIREAVSQFEWTQRVAVIEFPQVHRDTPNPNDIVKLASACGAYTAILQSLGFTVTWVAPSEWKGTVPKDIMFKRILAKVTPDEYTRLKKPKDHNVVDAVGIGLWHLNRKTQAEISSPTSGATG